MTRSTKLQMGPRAIEHAGSEHMTRKDPFDDVLDAFAEDFPLQQASVDELDRLYSAALSEGILTEPEIDTSFEAFLDRRVETDPVSGAQSLAPKTSKTWGEQIRVYRRRKGMTIAQLAAAHQLSAAQVAALEQSSEPYEHDRTLESAKAVSASTGVTLARVHTLLQSVRATLEIQASNGPVLLAARKAPPK
jgi:transcriptional regulator with XRE-family HTH domain